MYLAILIKNIDGANTNSADMGQVAPGVVRYGPTLFFRHFSHIASQYGRCCVWW